MSSMCEREPIYIKEQLKNKVMEKKSNKEAANMVLVGSKAPGFSAPCYHNGKLSFIDIESYRGKWVILCFYPGDFTFVCGTEVASIAAKYDELQALNTEVISVSVDSQFVHKMWNDNELCKMANKNIPFAMVTDGTGEIGEMYGVYNPISGVDVRGRFIIDPDGVIQAMEVLTPPVGRNVNEVIRQIQAYQLVRETKGRENTPAGWKPGKKTLKPSSDMIGNVYKHWNVTDLED